MPSITKQTIEISLGTLIKIVAVLLGVWILFNILDIISILIIAFIVVSAMEPAIDWLQSKKIPRTAGVIIIYIVTLSLVGLGISFIVPPLLNQTQSLAQDFPSYLQKIDQSFSLLRNFFAAYNVHFDTQQIFNNWNQSITNFTSNIFSTTIGVFSGLISAVVVLSLAFYMSVEENGITNFLVSITSENRKKYVASVIDRIKDKMGRWLLGQLMLMIIIAILVWIGLALIGVPHPMLLGAFAGLLEIIPYVGPIIGAVPGTILGFLVSPTIGFLAILVYLATQQFESHVVVPQVMKKAVGLSPITVILVLLIGAKLAGVVGAVLAVPIATAVSIFVKDFREGNGI